MDEFNFVYSVNNFDITHLRFDLFLYLCFYLLLYKNDLCTHIGCLFKSNQERVR